MVCEHTLEKQPTSQKEQNRQNQGIMTTPTAKHDWPDVFAGDDVLPDEHFVDEECEEEAAQLGVVQVLLDQLLSLHELEAIA